MAASATGANLRRRALYIQRSFPSGNPHPHNCPNIVALTLTLSHTRILTHSRAHTRTKSHIHTLSKDALRPRAHECGYLAATAGSGYQATSSAATAALAHERLTSDP